MTTEMKRQYLKNIRSRYFKASRARKSLILDEFCEVCGYTRKHAIKLLADEFSDAVRKPGPKPYYDAEVDTHLQYLWNCMGRINSKKMHAAMPLWLPFYSEADVHMKWLLTKISPATIDRRLAKFKEKAVRGLSSTSPSLIKNKIPIKLIDGGMTEPGYIAADTVAHCGSSLAGEFINSLTMTDIATSWTENRAVWKKESRTVMGAIKSIEKSLPFTVKGFASDNGNEFLNHDLHSYFFNRKNRVEFVRRRPYKKNDNAHVEQKNWTHVRQLWGYSRFDHNKQVKLMNDIYKTLWNPLWNYFTPCMKLKSKTRVGGKIVKVWDKPKTPYQRVIDSGILTTEQSTKLINTKELLNPFELKKELEKQLKWFFRVVEVRRQEVKRAAG